VPALKTAETNEQVDSDDESANQETFVDVLLRMENAIHKELFHSSWAVSFPAHESADTAVNVSAQNSAAASSTATQATAASGQASTAAPPAQAPAASNASRNGNNNELAAQLLKAYQQSVLTWTFDAVSWNDEGGVAANDKLSRILIQQVQPLQLLGGTYKKKFPVPADLYTKNTAYKIKCYPDLVQVEHKYLCTPDFPTTLKLSTEIAIMQENETGVEHEATWNSQGSQLRIKFTMTSASVTQGYLTSVENATKEYAQNFRKYLLNRDEDKEFSLDDLEATKQQLLREQRLAPPDEISDDEFAVDAQFFSQLPQAGVDV
jgi:hypothetical protein